MSKDTKHVIVDLYGLEADSRKNTAPDKAAKKEIGRILKMRETQPFPKCQYKSKTLAYKLDREAGISEEDIRAGRGIHTKAKHICSECRCRQVAGSGTKGWWYWPKTSGKPEVGHYGVGPCWAHSPYSASGMKGIVEGGEYSRMIQREIEAMQNYGAAPDSQGEWLVQVKRDTTEALVRNELRSTVEQVKEMAEDLKKKLDGGEMLTEMSRGEPVEMCDKTKYELRLKLLKSISDMAKTELDAGQWEMYHKDQIRIMVGGALQAAEMCFRPKVTTEEWKDFIAMFRDAVDGMQAGRKA